MEWVNEISLAPECQEQFITREACPELIQAEIAMAGVAQMRQQYVVARRDPEHHTLLFTRAGGGKLFTLDGEAEIGPHSMTLLPAREPFRFELDSQGVAEQWDLGWFLLDDSRYWQRLSGQEPGVNRGISWCRQALPLYHLLILLHYELESGESAGGASERQGLLSQVTEQLQRALTHVVPGRSTRFRLLRLFSALEDQLHRPWSVEDLAGRFPCSAAHFYRLCQQHLGCSPHQKLIALRLARSKHLLRYTDWQVSEIASRVGYQDLFTFSRMFKKQTGCSPTDYRSLGQC